MLSHSFFEKALNDKIKVVNWKREQKDAFINLITLLQKLEDEWAPTDKFKNYQSIRKIFNHLIMIFDLALQTDNSNINFMNDFILSRKSEINKDKNKWIHYLKSDKYEYENEFNQNLKIFFS